MAVISNATHAWSAVVTLTTDEFWEAREGSFQVFDGAAAPADAAEGILLREGQGYPFKSGATIYYKLATDHGVGKKAVLVRAKG